MPITVRRPTFDLDDLAHRWVGGSRPGTWFGDAAHVFIPLGEQFFIDAVKEFRVHIDDDELRRDVSAFIGQEAVHSRVHEAVWTQRRDLGVPVDRYATLIQAFQSALDPFVPPKLKLATTAALEHFTAAFGRAFLGEDIDDIVGTEMADLLRWHGAEEIEHRSVAFDVLGVVDDGIPLRLAGLVLGATLLTIVPSAGVVLFAVDELRGRRAWVPRLPNPKLLAMAARFAVAIGVEVARYAAPSFHPADDDPPPQYHAWLTVWHGSGRTD